MAARRGKPNHRTAVGAKRRKLDPLTPLAPVPSRPSSIEARIPARVEKALKTLEEALGGRERMVQDVQFSGAELDSEQQLLVQALADPDNDRRSLAKVVADVGLKLSDLLNLLKSAKGARALIESYSVVWKGLPPVVSDVMARSVEHKVACARCKGLGHLKKLLQQKGKAEVIEEPCPECNSLGFQLQLPELERQKVALQMGKMLKDEKAAAAPTVSIGFFSGDDLRKFQERSDAQLRRRELAQPQPSDTVEVEASEVE